MPRTRLRYKDPADPRMRGDQYGEGQPNDGMDMAKAGYKTHSVHKPGGFEGERNTPNLVTDNSPYPDYED